MRLNPAKIDRLSEVVFESLAAHPEITIQEGRDMIVGLIRRVITEDLMAEDEIEEAAHLLLEPHREEIQRKGASYDKLLRKAKQKVAQERKMVL